MKPQLRATTALMIAACSLLPSCATIRNLRKDTDKTPDQAATAEVAAPEPAPKKSRMAWLPKLPEMPLANLLPGNRVKVVDVREKDLRELPTGQDRATAYRQEKRHGFWIFAGPVNFEEPTLPEAGGEMDAGLLPPLDP